MPLETLCVGVSDLCVRTRAVVLELSPMGLASRGTYATVTGLRRVRGDTCTRGGLSPLGLRTLSPAHPPSSAADEGGALTVSHGTSYYGFITVPGVLFLMLSFLQAIIFISLRAVSFVLLTILNFLRLIFIN